MAFLLAVRHRMKLRPGRSTRRLFAVLATRAGHFPGYAAAGARWLAIRGRRFKAWLRRPVRLSPRTLAVAVLGAFLLAAALGGPGGPAYPAGAGRAAGPQVTATPEEVILMARVIEGEAADEPYQGKVAVGAVILNRLEDPAFPKSIPGVIHQPDAFEAVANGQIYRPLTPDALRAAREALRGADPTGGALYYWNPCKPVNPWVWSRPIGRQIGNHVFAY